MELIGVIKSVELTINELNTIYEALRYYAEHSDLDDYIFLNGLMERVHKLRDLVVHEGAFQEIKTRVNNFIGAVDLTDQEAFDLCEMISRRTGACGNGKLQIFLND